MALHEADDIQVEYIPHEIRSQHMPYQDPSTETEDHKQTLFTLQDMEEKYIKQVLKATDNNKSKAAKILGIHPTSLFRKLKSMRKKKTQ